MNLFEKKAFMITCIRLILTVNSFTSFLNGDYKVDIIQKMLFFKIFSWYT